MSKAFIADIAFEDGDYSGRYVKVGALLYFDHHMLKIKITKTPPINRNVIGKFIPSKLYEEAPYICGEICNKEDRCVGRINSDQNEIGNTLYWCVFNESISDGWYKVKLEDI